MNREGSTYSSIYYERTLEEWVQGAHAYLSRESNWQYRPLQPYTFGFDNIACSLKYAFDALDVVQSLTLEEIAAHIHDGWAHNYVWWRDQKPWLRFSHFKAPFNPLGDARRDTYASLKYADLPPDEQEKDKHIARYIIMKLAQQR